MKRIVIIISALVIAGFVFWDVIHMIGNKGQPQIETKQIKLSQNMKISSPIFKNEETIPSKYTCSGEDINPPLQIADVPENTKSLAMIVEDPDAPAGTWTHWTVWNVDPQTTDIVENSVPEGAIQGKTSAGNVGYHGPCPPSGTHRYFFKIYALDAKLNLTVGSSIAELQQQITAHTLDSAQLMGQYGRE